ncbi:hypothetical protein C8J55DRAFT_497255, partial [Lentinula edodes]
MHLGYVKFAQLGMCRAMNSNSNRHRKKRWTGDRKVRGKCLKSMWYRKSITSTDSKYVRCQSRSV